MNFIDVLKKERERLIIESKGLSDISEDKERLRERLYNLNMHIKYLEKDK
jgi:hypothetical protein